MASHQQDHDNIEQLKVCCCRAAPHSWEEKLIEKMSSIINEKLEEKLIEKMSSIINEKLEEKWEKLKDEWLLFQNEYSMKVVQETMNQLRSALTSNASLPPHQAESSASRSFQLCFNFEGNFPNSFLTKDNIEDVVASFTVELCDHTGKRVEIGPELCLKDLKAEFLVLHGDLKDDCTEEDFKKNVARPREDKPPLLKGNCEVSLSEGAARVCGFSFTDNSKWMRNGRFKLGAQLINGDRFGWIVRPAVSPPFKVKENRAKDHRKHRTPSPTDELYRLINIGKKGPVCGRALQNEVLTVMDFLQLYHTDPSELKSILRITGAKSWEETVGNAKECDLTNERYKYQYHDDASGDVLLLKCDFKIENVTFKGQTSQPYESLDDFQKKKVVELRKAAYKKRKELIKVYDSNNQTPVQAGLEYPTIVEQQERGELEEQPAPAPPSPSNIYPNVPDAVGFPAQICSNTAADHDNCQQDIMNTSASLTANAYGVQDTSMEVGTNSSVAYENLTQQVAYGLDWPEIPDITPAYQGDMNMQLMSIDIEDMMPSPNYLSNIDFFPFMEHMMPSSATIGFGHTRRWYIIRFIQRLICWRRRGAMRCRPQKKQKIY